MEKSVSKFMGLGLTVVIIVALLFMVGYSLVDSEVNTYKTDLIEQGNNNHGLNTGAPQSRN